MIDTRATSPTEKAVKMVDCFPVFLLEMEFKICMINKEITATAINSLNPFLAYSANVYPSMWILLVPPKKYWNWIPTKNPNSKSIPSRMMMDSIHPRNGGSHGFSNPIN